MVIDKFLKVNTQDPKADELRQRLAALQQKTQGQAATAPAQGNTTTKPVVTPAASSATQPTTKAPTEKDEIARLSQLSQEEQHRLVERQNPEFKIREERTTTLLMSQVQELIKLNQEAAKKLKEIDGKNIDLAKQQEITKTRFDELVTKMNAIDNRLEKFMGLYELITNQYNPFANQLGGALPTPPQRAPSIIPQPKPWTQPTRATEPATPPLPPRVAQPSAPQQVQTPASKPSETSSQAVKTTFTVSDNLTNQQAAIEINDTDLEESKTRFKQVEELLADLQKKEQESSKASNASQTQEKPGAPPQNVISELHQYLAGFEQRLQQRIDTSLQQKLHAGFSNLEQGLQSEIRDALRREIEQLQKDDEEVQQSLTELQDLMQAYEGKDRSAIEAELAAMMQQTEKLRDDVKAITPELYFRVSDGSILRDIHELAENLPNMSDATFAQHVTRDRNDFADWVEHALHLPEHATAMRHANNRAQLIELFRQAGKEV